MNNGHVDFVKWVITIATLAGIVAGVTLYVADMRADMSLNVMAIKVNTEQISAIKQQNTETARLLNRIDRRQAVIMTKLGVNDPVLPNPREYE